MPISVHLIPRSNIFAFEFEGDVESVGQLFEELGLIIEVNKLPPNSPTLTDLSKANLSLIDFDRSKPLSEVAEKFRGNAYYKRDIVVGDIKN